MGKSDFGLDDLGVSRIWRFPGFGDFRDLRISGIWGFPGFGDFRDLGISGIWGFLGSRDNLLRNLRILWARFEFPVTHEENREASYDLRFRMHFCENFAGLVEFLDQIQKNSETRLKASQHTIFACV